MQLPFYYYSPRTRGHRSSVSLTRLRAFRVLVVIRFCHRASTRLISSWQDWPRFDTRSAFSYCISPVGFVNAGEHAPRPRSMNAIVRFHMGKSIPHNFVDADVFAQFDPSARPKVHVILRTFHSAAVTPSVPRCRLLPFGSPVAITY